MGQRGLADAGHVLNQQVAAGEQAGHAVLHLRRLADNDRVKLIQQRFEVFVVHPWHNLTKNFSGCHVNTTGYFTHHDCRKHEMGPGHPECPERLDAIEDRLLITGVGDALDRREAPLAALGDIELAHDRMHVAAIRGLSDRLAEDILSGRPGLRPD